MTVPKGMCFAVHSLNCDQMYSCPYWEFEMLAKGIYYWALIALAACSTSGCYDASPKASRWDKAHDENTRTSTDHLREKSGNDLAKDAPPWNPGGAPSADSPSQKTDWKVGDKSHPSGSEPSKPRPPKINMNDLKSGELLPGGELNKFFPQQEGKWDLVYKQEKPGFVLVSLRRSGEELALLSITDLRSNPEAAEKYLQPSGEIDGYPTIAIGSKGLGLLVGTRFQVQVRSESDDFTASDRAEWTGRFDLKGLEDLK